MIIRTVSTLALYCSHCGRISMYDVSPFTSKDTARQALSCSCGQRHGYLMSTRHGQFILDLYCVLCEKHHKICITKKYTASQPRKVYCEEKNLELGIIGDRAQIETVIEAHAREVNTATDDLMEDPQVMIDMLNKVHDIAEKGGVICRCGSSQIEADVISNHIVLHCQKCGSSLLLQAKSDRDVLQLESLNRIELIPAPRNRRRKTQPK
ncbi:hypothetical protein [Acetonema longum]|uniref:Uncharacterized protein n=1 Tax=Acetonema longum DSM 6540 TaxID=1009370 RepID=F7NH91_9FIRM|nr:hypothetical protein [Acetonema longum]EGO64574.1 hypothetical protein ALO_07183 [Acetonema longum DSM 6540]